ncbi:MAG: hypothetical protein QE164_07865 [Candidatus Nezhaarchaeota archaeon]|nr:hypothetical protein [Candidatus Nezhaarchaeota archaeon]
MSVRVAVLPMKRLALPIDPRELSTDPEVGKRYVEDPLVFKDPTIKLLAELVGASRRVWRYREDSCPNVNTAWS